MSSISGCCSSLSLSCCLQQLSPLSHLSLSVSLSPPTSANPSKSLVTVPLWPSSFSFYPLDACLLFQLFLPLICSICPSHFQHNTRLLVIIIFKYLHLPHKLGSLFCPILPLADRLRNPWEWPSKLYQLTSPVTTVLAVGTTQIPALIARLVHDWRESQYI